MALALVIGILIGVTISEQKHPTNEVQELAQKYGQVLHLIDKNYVDSVDLEPLNDQAIKELALQLDPHTKYIPINSLKLAKSSLQEKIEGIGIEFRVIRDTLFVMKTIKNGPAEKAGLLPGDKILSVDGFSIVGDDKQKELMNEIVNRLQGPAGSKVTVSILRDESVFDQDIVRNSFPTGTIEAAYMIDSLTGYIKLRSFSKNAYAEFRKALDTLIEHHGMQKLVFDLRDNGGGYLNECEDILDELLPKGSLLVYTKGQNPSFHQQIEATRDGLFEKGRFAILINESSASASEIVAGAIQDNDRGVLIGRRTFGKGLVQQPTDLLDGSQLVITISRYYTPSGRSIQKPYLDGDSAYYHESVTRRRSGEMYSRDSIKVNDSLKFLTKNKRVVYGGGGIIPDFFVGVDTMMYTSYLGKLYSKEILNTFAIQIFLEQRERLKKMSFPEYHSDFAIDNNIFLELVDYAEKNGVTAQEEMIQQSRIRIQETLKALIARIKWGDKEFYQIKNEKDPALQKALEILYSDQYSYQLNPNQE